MMKRRKTRLVGTEVGVRGRGKEHESPGPAWPSGQSPAPARTLSGILSLLVWLRLPGGAAGVLQGHSEPSTQEPGATGV